MPDHSEYVGRQLKARREDLGLTQQDVADALEITTRTIQMAEHGRTTIRLRKRREWERILHLQRGTISQAYRDGTDLATIDITGSSAPIEPEPWREAEWAVYTTSEPGLTEEHRRRLVDTLREVLDLPPRRDWTPPPGMASHGESGEDAQQGHRLA